MLISRFQITLLSLLMTASVAIASPDTTNLETYKQQMAASFGLPSANHLVMLKVQGYQQTEDYTCGPSSVMSLMHYYGMLTDEQMTKATEMKIAKEMGTTKDNGTNPQQIINWLKTHGFKVTSGENGTIEMLQKNLKNGIPTIVEWIDWGGHWEVVTGYNFVGKTYNDDKDTIFFANPSAHFENANIVFKNGVTSFNPDRFSSMWFDAQYFKPGHLVKGIYIIATPLNDH